MVLFKVSNVLLRGTPFQLLFLSDLFSWLQSFRGGKSFVFPSQAQTRSFFQSLNEKHLHVKLMLPDILNLAKIKSNFCCKEELELSKTQEMN